MSSSNFQESATRSMSYSRKEKSLGVLCTNFLSLYNRNDADAIGLDEAAGRLGVERRRIYDVVNILESVGVVTRRAKNQYSWKGFEQIPLALGALQEEGMRENFISSCYNNRNVLHINESQGSNDVDGQENSAASRTDSRREKSLAQLTQNFIKLFVCSTVDLITLDSAAFALLGDDRNSTAMRTKIRRLYDIANVFSSMNLLEKTHHPESRKPAFRWLGWTGNPNLSSAASLNPNESQKRAFGTDITNSAKRTRGDSSLSGRSEMKVTVAMHAKPHDAEFGGNKSVQHTNHSAKMFEFGPFAPAGLLRRGNSSNQDEKLIDDLENLASYRPQYRNQASK